MVCLFKKTTFQSCLFSAVTSELLLTKGMTACTTTTPPQAVVLHLSFVLNKLFAVFMETCHLCRAAVSPGDAYPPAEGAGEPVHSVAHRSP